VRGFCEHGNDSLSTTQEKSWQAAQLSAPLQRLCSTYFIWYLPRF